MRYLRYKLSRLCRSRLANFLLSALGLASFSLYLIYQSDSMMLIQSGDKSDRTLERTLKVDWILGDSGAGGLIIPGAGQPKMDRLNLEDGTVKKRKSQKDEKIAIEDSAIYKHLQQLESMLLEQAKTLKARSVEVRGQAEVIDRDLPLYEKAFTKQGFIVRRPTNDIDADFVSNSTIDAKDNGLVSSTDWMILLCLAFTDGDSEECLDRSSFTKLHSGQKINRIPGIRNVLWKKDGFCYTMNQAKRIPALKKTYLSPMCWVMPSQYDQFLGVADGLGDDVRWVFKSTSPGGNIQVLQPTKERDYARLKEFRFKKAVAQQYFPNPLLVFGMPVNIRAYVLITSINPLRAFIHSEGLVHFRHDYQRAFKKIPNRTWYLAQFKHYLKYNFGSDAAKIVFQNLATVIVETLLVAESSLVAHFGRFSAHPWDEHYRCKNCFQLLGFDIIFNSTLHPMVVEVNGQPHLQANSDTTGWASKTIKQNAVDDAIAILLSETKVAKDVALALEHLHLNVGILGVNCHSYNQMCLTQEDLEYLLATRRETVNRGSYQQLYPSSTSLKYNSLLRDIQHFLTSQLQLDDIPPYNRQGALLTSPTLRHGTSDLQHVLANLEQYYWSVDGKRQAESPVSEDASVQENFGNITSHRLGGRNDVLISNVFEIDPMYRDPRYHRPRCSDDPLVLSELLDFRTDPAILLTPTFDPKVTEYQAVVPHEVALIKVWGFARSCDSEARLEDRYGVSRPSNYTLGVGENRISMLVVDITHSEPWVVNTYSVIVHRKSITDGEADFDESKTHQVCSLVQECNLQFLQGSSCGLNLVPDLTWKDYIKSKSRLPLCPSGDIQGEWLVPCHRCMDRSSCYWRQSQWQPKGCRYLAIGQEELQKCLAGKTLLFIGDSTNRGIMYYLMEKLNGTLTEWDKTHNIKVYHNLNANRTTVSFAYYPQFWLAASERPVFDKALYQLVRHSRPLENSNNTVLVVGGVHWLATHHLKVLQKALEREGLSKIRKMMKSLGAGFHQPVDGIHCLSLQEQRKIFYHNRGILDYAKDLSFDVLDTFNMTMARYREFLLGKCACHFHRVNEVIPKISATSSTIQTLWHYLRPSPDDVKTNIEDKQQRALYHVTGEINAVYSEILISRICGA
ncbi:cadherin-like and PC-esterase domain-containing protein 1 [Patiria miniata]|uniref:Cadherin-like and PC-esterase domain-containing protein 1 n=1 Tax=Patiria miniata TaxID=46514 RepID=A0A913ZS18_PATMI|nr:cadherin-like and PC-esterase domain-containing protein 1 [Patiria miniata]